MDDILKIATASSKSIKNVVGAASPLRRAKNIKQLARKNTIIFPVIATNSLSEETLIILLKAMEREYVAYLQVILSQNNIITTDHGDFSPTRRLGLTEAFFKENWDIIKNVGHESIYEEYNLDILNDMTIKKELFNEAMPSGRDIITATMNYLRQVQDTPLTTTQRGRVRGYQDELSNLATQLHALDAERNNIVSGVASAHDADRATINAKSVDVSGYINTKNGLLHDKKNFEIDVKSVKSALSNANNNTDKTYFRGRLTNAESNLASVNKQIDQINDNIKKEKDDIRDLQKKVSSDPNSENALKGLDTRAERINKSIDNINNKIKSITSRPSDNTINRSTSTKIENNTVKKYTEMEPTLLSVEVVYSNADGGVVNSKHLYAVKTHPHITTREDMNLNIDNAIKKKSVLLNFVKWVSGEVSLFKDLIFAVKDNKKAVKSMRGSKNSYLWDRIFDGHGMNMVRSSLKQPKQLPLTTLIMTIEDYHDLKDTYGIDLFKRRYIEDLYNKLLIANMIIVDENNGEFFQYDRDSHDYLTFRMDYVKKEGDKDGNVVKSILDFTNRR